MENEIKEEELFIPKTKHKALKIIFAIILIGALIAGGYYLYKEKFDNPNKTVISIIEDAEKNVKNELDDNAYKINGVLKIDANLSSELKPITDILKNLDLQFILESDVKNKLANATINAKYKKEQLIDINMFVNDNNAYVLLQDVYDKYLKLSMDDVTSEKSIEIPEINLSEQDIETLTNSLMKALKNGLNGIEFKRISTTIKIDDKDRNVYNNYADLKEAEMKKLIKDIINTLSGDNEFIKVFRKIAGEDAKIDDLVKELDNKTIPGTYRISFYTDKNILNQKLVSVRLEVDVDNVKSSITLDKISDEESLLSVNTSGGTIVVRVKKTNSVFNVNMNVNILGVTVKLDFSSNYEKIKEVTKPDVSDSKDIEKLTNEEQQAIAEKLQSNKGILKLIEDLSKIKQITL